MLRTLSLLAALLLAAPAFAQTHAEAMARLAPFEGTYDLDGTVQIETGTYGGTLTVAPTLGGHFQEWTWEMTMPEGDPTHLGFLVTYDAASGDYRIWRFDSRDLTDSPQALGSETEGTLRFEGDSIVMAWRSLSPSDPSMHGSFRNAVRVSARGLDVDTYALPEGQARVAIATTRASRR